MTNDFCDNDGARKVRMRVGRGIGGLTQRGEQPERIGRALQTGTVWVNRYFNLKPGMPLGGYKQSGFGREFCFDILEHYTLTKSVVINLDADLAERALGELEKLRQQHLGDYPSARCVVRRGVADAEIVSTARDEHVELIVIGTHGFSGLKHLLLGSTAERVVRDAPCPVLTVRHHPAKA